MTIFAEDDKICVKCSGEYFTEQIEICKTLSMRFDIEDKTWKTSIARYNEVFENFEQFNPEISMYTVNELKKWRDGLNELDIKTSRKDYRKFNLDLLTMPPTK